MKFLCISSYGRFSGKIKDPIGRFLPATGNDCDKLTVWSNGISGVPQLFEDCLKDLSEEQLNTAYRPGGWNITQVVHHVADSHMNAYITIKLALTTDKPTVSPYDENLWEELLDSKQVPPEVSVTLIDALHRRWVALLDSLTAEDWTREYYHPANKKYIPIWQVINLYYWHGRHHAEQIISLRIRMGW